MNVDQEWIQTTNSKQKGCFVNAFNKTDREASNARLKKELHLMKVFGKVVRNKKIKGSNTFTRRFSLTHFFVDAKSIPKQNIRLTV